MGAHVNNQHAFACLLHCVPPSHVDCFELFVLLHQLLGNIGRVEYRLEIHPLALALSPLLEHIRHDLKFVVPVDDPLLKGLLEWAELHGLSVHDVLIQNLLDLIIVLDQEGVLVGNKVEVDPLPHLLHFVQAHLNVVLL